MKTCEEPRAPSAEDELFSAGAMSYALGRGMPADEARAVARRLSKSAESYGPEDETFWESNRSWLLPLAVGGAAFWLGADGERNGRKDRGYIMNALGNVGRRVGMLFGIRPKGEDPALDAAVDTPGLGEVYRAEVARASGK